MPEFGDHKLVRARSADQGSTKDSGSHSRSPSRELHPLAHLPTKELLPLTYLATKEMVPLTPLAPSASLKIPLYLCGHAYASLLGSTFVTFCSAKRAQPNYVQVGTRLSP
jgi:hypothetical protein